MTVIPPSLHILLIEDNRSDAVLIEALLAESSDVSFAVETAQRLSTGLARLDRGGIDIVLLDLGLPDSQGLQTIEQLITHTSATIPTVILTGNTNTAIGFEAVRMGAQDYLMKGSFDGPGLVHTIRYAIERFKAPSQFRETIAFLDAPTDEVLALGVTARDLEAIASAGGVPAEAAHSAQTDILLLPAARKGNGNRGGTEAELVAPAEPTSPEDATAPDPTPDCPTNTDGRIRVEGVLTRGGMGVILKGWDTRLRREVAIKILRQKHLANPNLIERFVREARITGRLQHPAIISVLDLGESTDGRPFFTMRLVRGQTLDQILTIRSSVSAELRRFLVIFETVCEAVAYAHAQSVIHRDLKPENIMIGAFGVVQLMDWGLAKILSEDELPLAMNSAEADAGENRDSADPPVSGTQIGTVFGTPSYLPPEQARGELNRVDKRADVFGLGGILCEILTGQPPYTGTNGKGVYRKACRAELGEAHARLDACPAERKLVALAKWCLSAEPDDRPADGEEVATSVARFLESG